MCDTLVVVRDRSVLFAKSSDRDPNEGQRLDWIPRRRHREATVRCTHVEIPQVEETHAVLLSRPFWTWGAEIAANEHGVVCGNEAVFARARVPRAGLTGMDLVRLAVERGETAARAVSVLIELLSRHDQGGRCGLEDPGFRYFSSFLVADARGAFVVETAGRAHAVEEVRSGARSISNALSIAGFADAHGDRLRTWASEARRRSACSLRFAGSARDAGDLFTALRDHGHAAPSSSEAPRYGLLTGALGGLCVHPGGVAAGQQTTASWVAELREDGARHWVTATAAPCASLFKPVDVLEPLDLGPPPADRDDGRSLFWRHEALQRRVAENPAVYLPLFAGERDALEATWLAERTAPAAAFAEADRALDAWTARVARAAARGVPDVRPPWARRHAAVRARHAGLRLPIG